MTTLNLIQPTLKRLGLGSWTLEKTGSGKTIRAWDGKSMRLFFDTAHLAFFLSLVRKGCKEEEVKVLTRDHLKRRGIVKNFKEVGHGLR